jgi:predicted DsbA family dithiol-disulfide isomerase
VLLALASELGLNSSSLNQALTTQEFLEGVLADERDAANFGVRGVPAFIANRKAALTGVQPMENLKQLIESARD